MLHPITHDDRTVFHGLELSAFELDLARETRKEGAPLPERDGRDHDRELVYQIGCE